MVLGIVDPNDVRVLVVAILPVELHTLSNGTCASDQRFTSLRVVVTLPVLLKQLAGYVRIGFTAKRSDLIERHISTFCSLVRKDPLAHQDLTPITKSTLPPVSCEP